MKKFVCVCAAAAALCAFGAQLKKVSNLSVGEVGVVGAGKIASVEVISEVASGSVALSCVTKADIYTNAYDITVSTAEVMRVASVTTNRFFDHYVDGTLVGTFVEDYDNHRFLAQSSVETNRYFDLIVDGQVKLVFEEGGTNIIDHGVVRKDPMFFKSGDWRIIYDHGRPSYEQFKWLLVDPTGATNATALVEYGKGYVLTKEIDFGDSGRAVERVEVVPTSSDAGGKITYWRNANWETFWSIIDGNGVTNGVTRAEYGVGWYAHNINFGPGGVANERFEYIEHFETNTVVTVSTNSVTPVLRARVEVTNSVSSGTCSGGYFKGSPENAWMFGDDRLIFSGTATGGLLRLVVE